MTRDKSWDCWLIWVIWNRNSGFQCWRRPHFNFFFPSVWHKFSPVDISQPDKMQDKGQWHQLLEETNQKFSNINTTAMLCHGDIKVWPHFPDRMKQGQKKLLNCSGCFSFIELQMFWAKGQEANKAVFAFHKSWKVSAASSCLWELVPQEDEGKC